MLVVQKYGGTSVGSPERIRKVADRVARARRRGDDLVVVVSAMGHTTDELVTLAARVTGHERPQAEHPREMDMLLTAGERIAAALLTMAIREQGLEARSFTGSQAAIITDTRHTAARIREIRGERVRQALADGCVAIVAGFQGVSTDREITTLGRGGSDTSAVALAASLRADRCEIFTDVDGVFTADPRRVPGARVIPRISHAEMLEMAASGAQVMHPRAVDIGARFGVDIRVLSSFLDDDDPERGTLITTSNPPMEDVVITGLASRGGQSKLVLRRLPGGMGGVTEVLRALAAAEVSVDMVNEAADGEGLQLQITVDDADAGRARDVLQELVRRLGAGGLQERRGLARIAMVGTGMTDRPGVYARAYRALHEAGVEVHGVSTSAISITVLVDGAQENEALRAIHHCFHLGEAATSQTVAEH